MNKFKHLTRNLKLLTTACGSIMVISNSNAAANTISSTLATYGYFVNLGNDSYTQCGVDNAGLINNSTCITITPTGYGTLSQPSGVAFNNSFAYFSNAGNNSYTQCNVGTSGIEATTCKTFTPSGFGALSAPSAIEFNGNYAYFSNVGNDSYTQCKVTDSGINSNSCHIYIPYLPSGDKALSHPTGIVFNGNYAYFSNSDNNSYTQCDVDASSGINPDKCSTVIPYLAFAPHGTGALSKPSGIAFSGGYAYFSNAGNQAFTKCKVDNSGIESSSCLALLPLNYQTLSKPSGIAFNGDYVYFSNAGNNTYDYCPGLDICYSMTPENGALNYPSGVKFFPPSSL